MLDFLQEAARGELRVPGECAWVDDGCGRYAGSNQLFYADVTTARGEYVPQAFVELVLLTVPRLEIRADLRGPVGATEPTQECLPLCLALDR